MIRASCPYSLTILAIILDMNSKGISVFLKYCIDVGMSITRNKACKNVILISSGISLSKNTGY